MSTIAYGLIFVAMATTLLSPRATRPVLAALWAVILTCTIPVHMAPTNVSVLSLFVNIAVLSIAYLTPRTPVGDGPCALQGPGEESETSRSILPHVSVALFLVWDVFEHLRGTTSNVQFTSVLKALVLYLLVAVVQRVFDEGQGFRLVRYLILFSLPLAAVTAYEQVNLSLSLWPYGQGTDRIEMRPQTVLSFLPGRSQATFGHPTALGISCGFLAGLSLHVFQRTHKLIHGLCLIASLGALALSGTRAALLGTAVALFFMVYARAGRSMRLALLAVAAYALYAVDIVSVISGFINPTSLSVTHRSGVWGDIIPHMSGTSLLTQLVGQGFNLDKFGALFTSGEFNNRDGFKVFDNQVAYSLVLTGIIGLGLLLWVFVQAWRHGTPGVRPLLLIAVIGMLSFDLTSWQSCMIWLAVVLGMRRAEIPHESPNTTQEPATVGRTAVERALLLHGHGDA